MDSVLGALLCFSAKNSESHEMWMGTSPSDGCGLRFKEAVDHDGIPLCRGPRAEPSGFAIHNVRPTVDGQAGEIRKDDFAAKRNSAGIHGAVSRPQAYAVPGGAAP
jgi:hypothetical protein